MLQKGFLRPSEKEEDIRTIKRSRMFIIAGIFMVFVGFVVFMMDIQQETGQISIAWLILVVVGFLLVSISMWMNFFAQNKNRRR